MKIVLILFLMIVSGVASIKEIVVNGIFDHGDNTTFFQVDLPIPYHFTVQFDNNSLDLDPDPTVGLYEGDGLTTTLEFGSYHIESHTTAVTVFSGSDRFGVGIPAWGFQFGNDEEFDDGLLHISEYQMYGLFLRFDSSAAPTDALSWIELDANHSLGRFYDTYVKADGFVDGVHTRIQETGTSNFIIQDIPEPNLALVGLLTLFIYEKIRNSRSRRI